ncbi:unnamed protein product [Tuber aestivum]|uniref:WW domain-containing protein n=1 Tax=Tuber aestivum TaxID=59557 RepID=A0A292PWP1_9PEZI|nr:unnamed protein product [Tuber aestivum]
MEGKSKAQAPETNSGSKQTHDLPPGPPPPVVPEGWVAQYDPTYQRFYYVNLATQRAQWETPPGTVDPPTAGAEPNGGSPAHHQNAHPPILLPQISPPKETRAPRMDSCNQQMTEKGQQKKTGFASWISSLFQHGSPRSEPHQQSQPPVCYPPPIAQPSEVYVPQQRSSGRGTAGTIALGAGGGLLAGMALEGAISSYANDRYDQGFEDGADYVRENLSGALAQLERESVPGEGVGPSDFDEGD